jgi:hypothetical protein
MGFTQYLAASSGLVTTTQGWYPYLAPVLAPPRQVSLYTILVSAATGLLDHSTPLQVHMLGHHIWHILVYEVDTLRMPSQVIWEVVCQVHHLRTPSEVIPLVCGSMDTMPGYLSGGLCSWTPYLVLCCYGSQDHYTPIQTSGTTYVRYTISSTPSVVVHMLGGRMDTMYCYGCYATSAPTSYLWSWVCPGTSPDTL